MLFQLNPDVSAFQRKFTNDVRRCDEMERKLRFLLNELEKAGIEPRPAGNVEAPDPQGKKCYFSSQRGGYSLG